MPNETTKTAMVKEAIDKAVKEALEASGKKDRVEIEEFVLGAKKVVALMKALKDDKETRAIGKQLTYRDLMMLMTLDRVACALITQATCAATGSLLDALGQALKKRKEEKAPKKPTKA